MSPDITAAMIAFVGVLASVGVSALLARWTAKNELNKARLELTSAYAAKLLDARLSAYPTLYAVLSDFIKHIEGGSPQFLQGVPIAASDIRQLLADLVSWDSKNSLLLSDRAGRVNFALRQYVISLVLFLNNEQSQQALSTPAVIGPLHKHLAEMEVALKVDLGVYDVEHYEAREYYGTYREASEAIERRVALNRPGFSGDSVT
jgi:hypothetical protein